MDEHAPVNKAVKDGIAARHSEMQIARKTEMSEMTRRWRGLSDGLQAECAASGGHKFRIWSGRIAECLHCGCNRGSAAEAAVENYSREQYADFRQAIAEGYPPGIARRYSPGARKEWRLANEASMLDPSPFAPEDKSDA